MASSRTLFTIALAICCLARHAQAKVLMAYSIQRHGARNVLPKTALLQESDATGGPTLLPEGQSQANRAGKAYRARYIVNDTCTASGTCLAGLESGDHYGVVNTPGVGFSNYNLLARSSALDRTIMTALSFLDGALPPVNNATTTRYLPDGEQVVPVYSQADAEDILIRAYSKCRAYQDRLAAWFASPQFQAKAEASAALRASVGALVPSMNSSLQNWWNVYDAFNVWRTYGVGDPTPDVDNATFAAMQELAYWLETSKMASNLTGNLLGGTILGDLLDKLDAAVSAVDANVQIYYKVLHLSGHYNTQLGTLAALAIDTYAPAANLTWLKKIPSLAAIMVFELVGSDTQPGQFAVRLVMQDGPNATYVPIPLPCSQAGDAAEAVAGKGACTLDAFRSYLSGRTLNGSQWCAACNDTSTTACKLGSANTQLAVAKAQLAAAQQGTGTACNDDSSSSGSSSGSDDWKIAVSVVVTFVGTAALGLMGMLWMRRRYARAGWGPMDFQQGEAARDKP